MVVAAALAFVGALLGPLVQGATTLEPGHAPVAG
jgi:hypothetical protein